VGETLRDIVTASIPGTYLVEFIPMIKHIPAWVPGTTFHKVAKRTRILGKRFRDEPFQAAIDHMVRDDLCILGNA